jgi:hypothetical protein
MSKYIFRGGYIEDPAGDRWWSEGLFEAVETERDELRMECNELRREREQLLARLQAAHTPVDVPRSAPQTKTKKFVITGKVEYGLVMEIEAESRDAAVNAAVDAFHAVSKDDFPYSSKDPMVIEFSTVREEKT